MRAVRIAGIVLAAATVLVLCSAVYVRSTVGEMLSIAQSLPEAPSPETAAGTDALIGLLDRTEPLLGLTVPRPLMENARSLAVSLRERAEAGDAAGCAEARALLTDAVRTLMRMERVDIRNIM